MTDQPGQNPDPNQPDPNASSAGSGDYAAPPPPPPSTPAPPPTPPSGYSAPPPTPGYAQPGYQAPGPIPGYGQPAGVPDLPYANWGLRVQSALVDYFGIAIVGLIVYLVSRPLGDVIFLIAAAWGIYNSVIGGQTGQSYGKKMAGTKLVSATTGQPIGGGMGFARYIVHILDGIPCYLGYLWPLWDSKRQTFSDKIIGTYVLKA